MLCSAIIKSGNRKGEACSKSAKFGDFCGTHKDKETSKAQLGQFMSTNASYILQGIRIPDMIKREYMIEPFCGNGDMLTHYGLDMEHVECYDLEPQHDRISQRDTLLNPPDYTGRFVITNPPYLARNKATDKQAYERWDEDDLYKCFLKILILR